MNIKTEQKIKVWENKKEEVLKKHPDHKLSELRQLTQYLYVYNLYLDKLNSGLTYKEINNCYYEIKNKFIEQFPQVKTLGSIDMLIPQPVVGLYRKYWAVMDGHINFGDTFNYKLQEYYEAKEFGYDGIEVTFYDYKTRIRTNVGIYKLDEFLEQDFSNYKQNGITFHPIMFDENGKKISYFDEKEFEEFCDKKERERVPQITEIELDCYGVVCLENGLVFKHHSNAANYAGLKSGNSILKCCRGEQKTAGKHPETGERLTWTFYKNYTK